MPQVLVDDKSILVQVMASCHQAANHYLDQWWQNFVALNKIISLGYNDWTPHMNWFRGKIHVFHNIGRAQVVKICQSCPMGELFWMKITLCNNGTKVKALGLFIHFIFTRGEPAVHFCRQFLFHFYMGFCRQNFMCASQILSCLNAHSLSVSHMSWPVSTNQYGEHGHGPDEHHVVIHMRHPRGVQLYCHVFTQILYGKITMMKFSNDNFIPYLRWA